MQARNAATIIVAAICVGLAIGGAILLVGLQFHRSSHVGEHIAGRPAFVKELPESYAEAWADPVALATIGLVIVTAVLATFTYLLYSSAAETARDAKEASAKALDASTRATQTLVNLERAYLTGGGDVEWISGQRCFRVEVANYGKTAAYLSGFYVQFATRAELTSGPPPILRRYVFDDQSRPGVSPEGLNSSRLTIQTLTSSMAGSVTGTCRKTDTSSASFSESKKTDIPGRM